MRVADDHAAGADAPGQTIALRSGGLATSSTHAPALARGAPRTFTTSSTRRPAPRPREHWRTVSVAAATAASTRTSRAPPRSSAARGALPWLEASGLPARLVAADGAVTRDRAAGPTERRARRGLMLLANVGPSALWYLTRATGAVTLLLLTISVALGVANIGRVQAAGWPRFVIEGLHRNVSLLALVLLLVHIVTTLLDPFAGIKLIDAVIPFTGSYRPLWLGLGAFASDLLIAVALTSIVRRRLGHGAWRATHWLAYLCWPVAILHTVGTGSDVKQVWMLALTAACVATVVARRLGAGRLRLARPARAARRARSSRRSRCPLIFVAWLPGGPLGKDWARRAGTPLARPPARERDHGRRQQRRDAARHRRTVRRVRAHA